MNGMCPVRGKRSHRSAGSVGVDTPEMIHFQKKGSFVWPPFTCTPGICNYEITWSAGRGSRGSNTRSPPPPLDVHCVNSTDAKSPTVSSPVGLFKRYDCIFNIPIYQNCVSTTSFCWHNIFPSSPLIFFHLLRASFAEQKLDRDDVYFRPSRALCFKIEPTFVHLIPPAFETV